MADAYESGATARPPSAPAEDRVLRFPKEQRRASLHGGAGAGLHRPFISQGIEMPTKPRSAATGPEQEPRFELGGYYLERPHPEHLGFWYACRYDPGTRQVRRRSLKTTDFEEAKVRLAALVASAPSSANRIGPPGPDQVLSVAALKAYLDERGSHIASEYAAERAVELFTDYLTSISKIDAPVAFWTPARQLELAKWCVEKHGHSAGYIERLFNVMRSAFNDACVTKIRLDAVGNQVETALMSHAPKIVWKREAIASELKIPARRPRPVTLSVEQMAAVLDSLKTPHLFRFAIMSLCTWARPQAIIDFDLATQVDLNGGVIDLAPIDWVPTKKRRPRQSLTGCSRAGYRSGTKKMRLGEQPPLPRIGSHLSSDLSCTRASVSLP